MSLLKRFFFFIFKITAPRIYLTITLCSIIALLSLYVGFDFVAIVGSLENQLLDIRMRNRGVQPTSEKIGIVGIDENSIEHLGRWPFKRKDMAKFLQKIKEAEVHSIGFDVVFSEKERPIVSDELPGWLEQYNSNVLKGGKTGKQKFLSLLQNPPVNSVGDIAFKQSIKDLDEKVVLGWFYFVNPDEAAALTTDFDEEIKKIATARIQPTDVEINTIYGIRANTEFLSDSSKLNGFFSNSPDPDGFYRWAYLLTNYKGHLYPALSLTLAKHYLKAELAVDTDEFGVSDIRLTNKDGKVMHIPTDVQGNSRLLVNYRGPEKTFPHYSLYDIYSGKVGKKELKGKVLLVGATATGLSDIRPTPFSETNPGVEIHASITDNIITGEFLKRDKDIYLFEILLVLLIGIVFGFIIDRMKALTGALSVILFSVIYFFVDDILFFKQGIWTYMGIPYLEIMSIYLSVTIYKYFTVEKEKKKVRGAFQHYLNASVIEQILDDPEALQLGGEKKELTVFFSDVRGFTTISETLSAEHLTKVLNEYFTPMTDIVLKNDGLLDKYMGDAIMAVWGAPINMGNHALHAVDSAVEMFEVLIPLQEKWEEEGVPPIDIGIGINTGVMTVGNMGSDQRFDYTVMGDSVNLGSRLEGINKSYGSRIIVSEFTYEYVKDESVRKIIRPLDLVRVKGKNEPVHIYQVLEPKKYKPYNDELIANFTEGFANYQKQEWDTAISYFNNCINAYADDGAAQLYIERCTQLKANPPGDDWNGVFVFTTK